MPLHVPNHELWIPPRPAIIRTARDIIPPVVLGSVVIPGIGGIVGFVGQRGISYVGGNSNGGIGSGSVSVSLTALTGGIDTAARNGDLVVVFFGASGTVDHNLSIATAGYTEHADLHANDTDDAELCVATKFMTSSPDTSVAANTTDGSTGHVIAVQVFRGVDPVTPLDVAITTATASNSVLANPPSITPVTPGAFVVAGGCGGHGDGLQTYGSSDLTNFVTAGVNIGGVNDPTVGMGYIGPWASGAVDPAQFTFSGSNGLDKAWVAATLALRPA